MKWSATCFCPDFQFLSADDFKDLETMVLEIQSMLASFVQRLTADV
jgi:hypothetical protein